jgi:hypothetical protein
MGRGKIIVYGRPGETPLLYKVLCETLFDSMKGATFDLSRRDITSIAQIPEQIP